MVYADSVRARAATLVAVAASIGLSCIPGPRLATAAIGDCGQIVSDGDRPVSSDALHVLGAAVHIRDCDPRCLCDVDGSGDVEAPDALAVLSRAVYLEVELRCRCERRGGTSETCSPDDVRCDDGIDCTQRDACAFGACTGADACADNPFASCGMDEGRCLALPRQLAPEAAAPELRLDERGSLAPHCPRVAAAGADGAGFVAVWEADTPFYRHHSVFARAFGRNGEPRGAQVLLNERSGGLDQRPDVAASDDAVLVAWSAGSDGDGRGIFARILTTDARSTSGELELNVSLRGDQVDPTVAGLPGGSFVVAWADARPGVIAARRVGRYPWQWGREIVVSAPQADVAGPSAAPAVASLPDASSMIVWRRVLVGTSPERTQIVGRMLDDEVRPLGAEIAIGSAIGAIHSGPHIAAYGAERFVVAWDDGAGAPAATVLARTFDRAGRPLGAAFHPTPAAARRVGIGGAGSDGFVAAWSGAGDASGARVLAAQAFEAGARPVGAQLPVSSAADPARCAPDIAVRPGGEMMIVWEDFTTSPAAQDAPAPASSGTSSSTGAADSRVAARVFGAPDTSFLTRKGEGSDALACAYYNLVDPLCQDLDCDGVPDDPRLPCERATLGGWWRRNGFDPADGSGRDVVRGFYLNHNDLGFGREMNCHRNDSGCMACYVTNYGRPDQHPANAELALDADPAAAIATVAMEHCTVEDLDDLGPVTKFFVYGDGRPGSGRDPRARRQPGADLDGFGVKFVPNLCFNCHGGDARLLEATLPADLGALDYFGSDGEILAGPLAARRRLLEALTSRELSRFLPFDLAALRYPDDLDRPAQEKAFKRLNELVLETEPGAAIEELITGWYDLAGAGTPVQLDSFVPNGWRARETRNPLTEELYAKVIAPRCRGCHTAFAPPFDFSRFGDLLASYDFSTVCGPSREMPHAFTTYKNFWADRDGQLALADHLVATGRSLTGCGFGLCSGGERDGSACVDDGDCSGGRCSAARAPEPVPIPVPTTTVPGPVAPTSTTVTSVTSSTATPPTSTPTGASTTSTTTAPSTGALTWPEIQATFAVSCAGLGCHTEGFAGGSLGQLDDVVAGYDNLVAAPVLCVPAGALTQRVVPGDPDASFLVAKLEGTPDCGLPMPLIPPALPPDVIAGIRAWIEEGAPR